MTARLAEFAASRLMCRAVQTAGGRIIAAQRYRIRAWSAGVTRSECIRRTPCFAALCRTLFAGSGLALLNKDAPGSVHHDMEFCLHSDGARGRTCICTHQSFISCQIGGETLEPNVPGRSICLLSSSITQARRSTAALRTQHGNSTCRETIASHLCHWA